MDTEFWELIRPVRMLKRFKRPEVLEVPLINYMINQECDDAYTDFAMAIRTAVLGRSRVEAGDPEKIKIWSEIEFHMSDVGMLAFYKNEGSECFILSDGVLAELQETSLEAVMPGDFRLPYLAFYVGFDTPISSGSGEEFEGFFCLKNGSVVTIHLCLKGSSSAAPWHYAEPRVQLSFDPKAVAPVTQVVDDFLAQARAAAVNNQRIVADAAGEHRFWQSTSSKHLERLAQVIYSDREFLEKMVTLAFNSLCLLSAVPAEMSSVSWHPPARRTGRSKVAKRIPGTQQVRRISFGQSQASGGALNSETGGPRAHWRRGHWRRVRVGSRGEWRYELRWIRPTLVNPSAGPTAESSIYEVKT